MYHRRETRCHVLPSFKQRNSNASNGNDVLSKKDKSKNLKSSLTPLMQPELDMESDRQISIEQQKDVDSSESSQWILIGGTALVLAAAFALGVSMSNELGIDLEWR